MVCKRTYCTFKVVREGGIWEPNGAVLFLDCTNRGRIIWFQPQGQPGWFRLQVLLVLLAAKTTSPLLLLLLRLRPSTRCLSQTAKPLRRGFTPLRDARSALSTTAVSCRTTTGCELAARQRSSNQLNGAEPPTGAPSTMGGKFEIGK